MLRHHQSKRALRRKTENPSIEFEVSVQGLAMMQESALGHSGIKYCQEISHPDHFASHENPNSGRANPNPGGLALVI